MQLRAVASELRMPPPSARAVMVKIPVRTRLFMSRRIAVVFRRL